MKVYFVLVLAAVSCMWMISADRDADSACAECLSWTLEYFARDSKLQCETMKMIQQGELCFTCDNDTIATVCGGLVCEDLNCQMTDKNRKCIARFSRIGPLDPNCPKREESATCERREKWMACNLKSALDVCPKQLLQFLCVNIQTFSPMFGARKCNYHCPSFLEATETVRHPKKDESASPCTCSSCSCPDPELSQAYLPMKIRP